MGRISRQVMFMDMARAASRRSTCFRLNVGAIVTSQNNPVAVGWNGARSGAPHCAGNDCPGIVPGNCGTLHAEANALKKANNLLMPCKKVDLYCTDSPCPECTLLLMNSDLHVERIFFERPYRSREHLDMLRESYADPTGNLRFRTTEVYEVTPAGYTVEYFTRRVVELP